MFYSTATVPIIVNKIHQNLNILVIKIRVFSQMQRIHLQKIHIDVNLTSSKQKTDDSVTLRVTSDVQIETTILQFFQLPIRLHAKGLFLINNRTFLKVNSLHSS